MPAAYAAQFATPPAPQPILNPPTPTAVAGDPDPDLPGTARMISGMYQLTDAAIRAGAYSFSVKGEIVQRYRKVVCTVVKKRPREGKEPLFECRLVMSALLADHEGKIVEVQPGATVLLAGVFGIHPMGSLVGFPAGHATIVFRPTHCDHDLAGNPLWHGTLDVLVEDQRDAQGRQIPKLVSSESVLGPAPAAAAPNGAAVPAAARA